MGPGGLRYAPGLDGVRALAVLSVFVYHLAVTSGGEHYLSGGFIGVDVFFVLSGYLITSLLMVEFRTTGRLSLKGFYVRRARRLLPAVFALLLMAGLIGSFWLTQQAARIKGDIIASLGYVTNWWLIFQEHSYFGTGDRPPLLTHLWSLAVEEQFYLVWPLLLLLFARNRARRRTMLTVLLLLILTSTMAAALLYDPWADPSRVYYGTDTRAAAPLIGAAAALLLRPWQQKKSHRSGPWDAIGFAGLAGLAAIAWFIGDRDPLLYHGGFLVTALAAAALVVAAGHPATLLGDLLGLQPLRWLGQRSYAFYLWHWPVCALTQPGLDVPWSGWANTGLRLGLTLALAEISYWLVERPLRPRVVKSTPDGATMILPVYRKRRIAPAVTVTAVVLVAFAGVGYQLTRTEHVTPLAAGAPPIDDSPDLIVPVKAVPSAPVKRAIPVKVTLFGDSQGRALFANKPADIATYLTLTDASAQACGILRGKVRSRIGETHDLIGACPNWLGQWERDVLKSKPDIALVIIGAWEVFDLQTSTSKMVFGTPEWDALLLSTLEPGLRVLKASGAAVAIALLPCYRPFRNTGGAGYWPDRGDDTRTRHVNTLLKQAAVSIGATTIDPPAEFCTDDALSRDVKVRWDGIHYGKPGAALYFGAIIPQLLIVPN
ncbi:acyltransferase family protein [Catelliglobosispora koreensis]|uniref:acyltransferase family protein n=1 Tax=Catelliglobosispora koreensis TaxID=129052 RepID=UPI00036E82C1|nr:acyltransferase family protein [Catelliglobosispora koreensis]